MIEQQVGEVRLLAFQELQQHSRLAHAFTSRPQNYAPHRGTGKEQAMSWRQVVCEYLGMNASRITAPSQVHGGDILRVESADIGRGHDGRDHAIPFIDGLITNIPNVPLLLLSADCPVVCAYDPDHHAIGAVHASWRGTVASITANMVHQMQRSFGSDPGRLSAAICPCAGPCCYEVGRDVQRVVQARFDDADDFFRERNGRLMFDLWSANRRQLVTAGVPERNIETAALCSICDTRFWSHRRDGEPAGRSALFIALRQ